MKSQWIGRNRRPTIKARRGSRAEKLALEHLEAAGLNPVTRNFRCRSGEIDLIMQDRDCLVFVEVRFRSSPGFVSAADSVDDRKQRKIARAAAFYLACKPALSDCPVRFDVVAIESAANSGLRIQWIKDAFRV